MEAQGDTRWTTQPGQHRREIMSKWETGGDTAEDN